MWLSGHCDAYPCTEWTLRREQRQRLKAQQKWKPFQCPRPGCSKRYTHARTCHNHPRYLCQKRWGFDEAAKRKNKNQQASSFSEVSEDSSSSGDDSDEDSSDDDDDAEVDTSTLPSSATGAGAGADAGADAGAAATVESGRHWDAILELAEAILK